MINKEKLFYQLNTFCIFVLSSMLATAFYFQFVENEEPCPLCLLQRIALIGIIFGLCLNSFYRLQVKHFALIILVALTGIVFATRQVFLHIEPGSSGYGSAILGLHMYTWSDLVFFISIFCSAGFLFFIPFSGLSGAECAIRRRPPVLEKLVIYAAILLVVANVLSAGSECGIGPCCEDGPCPAEVANP